jgi:hypothetical protein
MKILFDPDVRVDQARLPIPVLPPPAESVEKAAYPIATDVVAVTLVPRALHPRAVFESILPHPLPIRILFTRISPHTISILYPAVGVAVLIPTVAPLSNICESESPTHPGPNLVT